MNLVGREIADLFYNMTEADMFALMQYFDYRHFCAGETLWQEGDDSAFAGFIVSGRIQIKKNTEFAGKQMLVGVYSQGTIIGELGLMEDDRRTVSAAALEDGVLITLNRDSFEKLIAEHPELGVKLLKSMFLAVSVRLSKSFDRLAAIF